MATGKILWRALIIFMAGAFVSCHDTPVETILSTPGLDAESVYLTKDHRQRPVIAWTERDSALNRYFFYYAVSDNNGRTFSKVVSVPVPHEIKTHAEGMPKVAFKHDGTVIAAYEKSAPTPENKRAGAVYFLTSVDKGVTWSETGFVHSDTVSGRSRGFFDIATLPDGEVGASWLDIKSDMTEKGRSIRFSKTRGVTFIDEIVIDPFACECCRIDLYGDEQGAINIAYRSVRRGPFGKHVRDMMWVSSTDNGNSFSIPQPVSDDKWMLDGCPHTGPSLARNADGLHSLWYTEGNGKGVYLSTAANGRFNSRELISHEARNPQMAAAEKAILMVWSQQHDDINAIRFQYRDAQGFHAGTLTAGGESGYFPVVTAAGKHTFVTAYIALRNGKRIVVTKILSHRDFVR
jgi:hypothetical protein